MKERKIDFKNGSVLSGVFDMDSELEMWFSSVEAVKFEFTRNSDIVRIGQAIGSFIL